jgi:hypothetical protein
VVGHVGLRADRSSMHGSAIPIRYGGPLRLLDPGARGTPDGR